MTRSHKSSPCQFRPCGSKNIHFYICHVSTCLKNFWPCILWLLILKHHHVKFTEHRSRKNGDITFFSCHMIWCVYEINGLCDFLDDIPPSEATSLPSFVAIVIAEVLFVFVCMWSLFNVGISVTMELLRETNLNQQKWK